MKLFEFEAKDILQKYGLKTPQRRHSHYSWRSCNYRRAGGQTCSTEGASHGLRTRQGRRNRIRGQPPIIVQSRYPKPVVVAYIAARSVPPEKRVGHAGAIIMGSEETTKSKIDALAAAGVPVVGKPSDIVGLLMRRGG